MVKFQFSLRATIITIILAGLMCRASYWQYTKWVDKKHYLTSLDQRLSLEPVPLSQIWNGDWESLIHRRVIISGEWDFDNEFILRNRKYKELAGSYLITPIRISGITPPQTILVSRGFIPLEFSQPEDRVSFRSRAPGNFVGLIKEGNKRKLFAPSDPDPEEKGKIDAWLRIDPALISKQLSYPIAPVYVEIFPDHQLAISDALLNKKSDKDNMLFMPSTSAQLGSLAGNNKDMFPVPQVDLIVPPDRHYSYIFEWLILAFFTVAGGIIMQLRRF